MFNRKRRERTSMQGLGAFFSRSFAKGGGGGGISSKLIYYVCCSRLVWNNIVVVHWRLQQQRMATTQKCQPSVVGAQRLRGRRSMILDGPSGQKVQACKLQVAKMARPEVAATSRPATSERASRLLLWLKWCATVRRRRHRHRSNGSS